MNSSKNISVRFEYNCNAAATQWLATAVANPQFGQKSEITNKITKQNEN